MRETNCILSANISSITNTSPVMDFTAMVLSTLSGDMQNQLRCSSGNWLTPERLATCRAASSPVVYVSRAMTRPSSPENSEM